MKFLPKETADKPHLKCLRYPKDRETSVKILVRLQKGYCAYSERYLKPLDSVELEHFDPRKKNTDADGFSNWHAVLRWMNAHKARNIEKFEPLPDIDTWTTDRVRYEYGCFVCAANDVEAKNLIEFLGVNRPEVFQERANHVARIKNLRLKVGDNVLIEILSESPEDLSFPSALEAELEIPVFEIIGRCKK